MKLTDTWNRENIAKIETLFHTANGYLGVRNAPEQGQEEGSIRGAYLNAFYELIGITYGEKQHGYPEIKQTIVNVPDTQTIRIFADGKQYSMFDEETRDRVQTLDMDEGVARRTSTWLGGKLEISFERMASFENRNLFLLRTMICSRGYAGNIRVESTLNGNVTNYADPKDIRVAAEALRALQVRECGISEDEAYVACDTFRSALSLCCRVAHDSDMPGIVLQGEGECTAVFEAGIRDGQTLRIDKYVVYTDSRRFADPVLQASCIMREARKRTVDAWMESQKAWISAWRSRVLPCLQAPAPLPEALEYDLYQMLQSTGRDGIGNVEAKGLSGEGYEGHTFWDSEIYVFPFFLWTQPETARGMLTYRYRTLDKARRNARTIGIAKGALFPWRTINGDECSAYYPAGTAQYHINADVAHAFIEYWLVTGDVAFMEEMGAEVLVETARMWMELGHMQDGEFRIDCVTGPDEYTAIVNNNFYTNAAAQYNLMGTVDVLRALQALNRDTKVRTTTGLQDGELEAFEEAARKMALHRDEKLGISPQDDSFLQKKRLDFKSLPKSDFPLLLHYHPLFIYRHQVCKQADTVLAHLLFPESVDPETARRSYTYYDEVTTHDSSLSECVFATQAARLGMMERAVKGFGDTAILDLLDTHGNTKDGLHTASLGGTYLAMLIGFAGIRVSRKGLSVDPVLPKEWDGYTLPFSWQNRRFLLEVSRDECCLKLLFGDPADVTFQGRQMRIA